MAEKEQDEMLSEDDEQDQSTNVSKKEEYVAVEDKPEAKQADGADSDDDEDDESDSRLADDGEDREEVRKRRRIEKQERTQRRKAAIERDKLELNFLRQRNEELELRMQKLETHTLSSEARTIDQRLTEAIEEARAAERIMAKAIEAGAGEDVTKALKIRDEALVRAQKLNAAKQQLSQQQQAKQQAPNLPDPVVAELAKNWIAKNSWYNPKGQDVDSKIVQAIDQALTNEGYNPRSEEYWDELDRRVSRRFPDKKVQDDDDDGDPPQKQGRKGPAIGSSRDHAPSSTRKEIYISPERKQALIDAGVWDDHVLRQRYLKQYAKWDRENNATR